MPEEPLSNDKCFIYGLRDPRNGEIRYVGQTSRGILRILEHTKSNTIREHSHLYVTRWLISIDLRPQIVILQRLDIDHLSNQEKKNLLERLRKN